jgi:cell division protein FtsQ
MASAGSTSHGRRIALRRAAVVLLAVLPLLLGVGYLLARQTSLFAVRAFDVAGAPADLERVVEAALARFQGTSLVSLDSAAVERALEALPAVRGARVSRDFPHTVDVVVRPEHAVAVLRRDGEAWLVAASGRVLETLEPGQLRGLPRVWVPAEAGALAPGDVLPESTGAAAVRALARLPGGFPARVLAARGTRDELTLVLEGGTELRLGDDRELRVKLAAAAAALGQADVSASAPLAYLDVSLPARPVGMANSQVDTSA